MKKKIPSLLPFLFLLMAMQTAKAIAPRIWDITYGVSRYNSDFGRDVAVLSSGNSIVVGDVEGLTPPFYYSNITVSKFNKSGGFVSTYSSDFFAQNQREETIRILVKEPYIYVLGTAIYNNGVDPSDTDIFLIKLDTSLSLQWIRSFNGILTGDQPDDKAVDMGMDAYENIFVTGTTQRDGTGTDILLLKYNASGGLQWIKYNTSSGNASDVPVALKVSPTGYCYIAGTKNHATMGTRLTAMKYASTGVKIWEKYNDVIYSMAYTDEAAAISYDPVTEDVYVTGRGEHSPGDYDWVVAKFDGPTGVKLWSKRYAGLSGYTDDRGVDISYFNQGALYVCGNQFGASGGSNSLNMVLKKLDPSTGNTLWSKTFSGPTNERDLCSSLMVVPSGNIYVMGTSERTGFGMQNYFIVLKYTPSGTVEFRDSLYYTLNGACMYHSTYALKAAYNSTLNRLVVLGRYAECTTGFVSKWVLTCYNPVSLKTGNENFAMAENPHIVTVFPNPVYDYFTIQSDRLLERIIVTDLTGRKIHEAEINAAQVQIESSQWPAGAYTLQLMTEGQKMLTRKIIKNQ